MHESVYKQFHIYVNVELKRKTAPAILCIRETEILLRARVIIESCACLGIRKLMANHKVLIFCFLRIHFKSIILYKRKQTNLFL